MMKHEGETFERIYDDGGSRIEALRIENCIFQTCWLSLTMSTSGRSIVQNVSLKDCEFRNCGCGAAIIEDCSVDGLKTHGLFQCFGAVFKHVVLRGRIERIMLSAAVQPGRATPEVQRSFDAANADYYKDTNWALDIREAELQECEIQGVPSDLILRDSETQVVVRRSVAAQGRWRSLNLAGTHWPTAIDLFLKRGDADMVLVAPRRAKNFRRLVEGLRLLVEEGVAEGSCAVTK